MPLSALEQAAEHAAAVRKARSSGEELRRLGVVPTPSVLVRFALARVDRALRDDLGLAAGLASPELELVDPAVGTGTWLSSLLASLAQAGATGPARILGIDADAEALAAARRLLTPAAHALGTQLELCHANTLALASVWSSTPRVRVVIGNPPWAARSLSKGVALSDAWLREFHCDPSGAPLKERRSGVLSDDYVRFFRWALQQAREAPRGAVIGLVTNASYLDGPVHRGMRGALAHAFDRLEVVDLGGNTLRSRGAEPDEALFPVRVGAALTLCVRAAPAPRGSSVSCSRAQPRASTIAFSALRGSRQRKTQQLSSGALHWATCTSHAPQFAFRPGPRAGTARQGFALHEAFPFHAEGIQTNRDALATAGSEAELRARLVQIARGERTLQGAPHCSPALVRARLEQALEGPSEALIGRFAYRPFEPRAYCKLAPLCHRPRALLARAVAESRLCLVSVRKEPGSADWNMFAPIALVADSSFLSTRSSCRTRVFPSHGPDGAPNLAVQVVEGVAERVGFRPSAEQLVAYVAGVLGAPTFRRAQRPLLAQDYARIPWPCDAAMFAACAAAGQRFAALLVPDAKAADLAPGRSALFVRGTSALDHELPRRALRWLSPHLLEVGGGTQIGARNALSLGARVGHHLIVESAYRAGDRATIAAVVEACARALMWGEAEQAADAAYSPASCVGPDANAFAHPD